MDEAITAIVENQIARALVYRRLCEDARAAFLNRTGEARSSHDWAMTLVVARQRSGVIWAVSDTGVIERNQQLGWDRQLAKICILTPNLAVGFAGVPEYAQKALDAFQLHEGSYSDIVDYFLDVHKHKGGSVDFILMFNKPSSKIVKIQGGSAHKQLLNLWIGHKPGFDEFQHIVNWPPGQGVESAFDVSTIFSAECSGKLPDLANRMIIAMRHVLDDRKILEVFGFCIALTNEGGELSFC